MVKVKEWIFGSSSLALKDAAAAAYAPLTLHLQAPTAVYRGRRDRVTPDILSIVE